MVPKAISKAVPAKACELFEFGTQAEVIISSVAVWAVRPHSEFSFGLPCTASGIWRGYLSLALSVVKHVGQTGISFGP